MTQQTEVGAWAGEPVDVLAEIAACRAQMRAAESRMRLLIAYGREFVHPRPYTLAVLAAAADMSISGVRTAYGPAQVTEIAAQAERSSR